MNGRTSVFGWVFMSLLCFAAYLQVYIHHIQICISFFLSLSSPTLSLGFFSSYSSHRDAITLEMNDRTSWLVAANRLTTIASTTSTFWTVFTSFRSFSLDASNLSERGRI